MQQVVAEDIHDMSSNPDIPVSILEDANVVVDDVDVDINNDDGDEANEEEADGNENEDDGNENEDDGNEEEDDGNEEEDDWNENEDDGNENEDDGNENEDDGNENEDDGNENVDGGNENVDDGNENVDDGNEDEDDGNEDEHDAETKQEVCDRLLHDINRVISQLRQRGAGPNASNHSSAFTVYVHEDEQSDLSEAMDVNGQDPFEFLPTDQSVAAPMLRRSARINPVIPEEASLEDGAAAAAIEPQPQPQLEQRVTRSMTRRLAAEKHAARRGN